jgi:hypothetical protein
VKQELRTHLTPLLAIFVFISLYWFLYKVPAINSLFMFLGLLGGSFILDIDHLIFWFYLRPNIEESRVVQSAFRNHDFKAIYRILDLTHHTHTNLIFHHYFFQVVLALISLFIFTSTQSIFTKSFILAINLHLLVDEINDFYTDKKLLQKWLFAREAKQLSIDSLKYYVFVFIFFLFTFIILLLKSKP